VRDREEELVLARLLCRIERRKRDHDGAYEGTFARIERKGELGLVHLALPRPGHVFRRVTGHDP
jgi:hypothetical protein